MSAGWFCGGHPAMRRPDHGWIDRGRRGIWFVVLALACGSGRGDIVLDEIEPMLRLDLPGHTGEVRALEFTADGSRLISGGRDKVGIVWQLGWPPGDAPAQGFRDIVLGQRRERAIRWQIARGQRGWIQCLAASPGASPSVIAVAGYGTMASTGEIVLVDARDGSWLRTLGGATDTVTRTGHRQRVSALEFTADGSWLVSRDLDGEAFAWKRPANVDGDWVSVQLEPAERVKFGVAGAQALRAMPPVRPLVTLGNDRVAIPVADAPPDAKRPIWKIRVKNLAAPGTPDRILALEHPGAVMALAATPDGGRLASADYSGQVALLDPAGGRPPVVWELKTGTELRLAESLAITPDGAALAIGVARTSTNAGEELPPRVEIWDVAAAVPRMVATRAVTAPVRALRASRDGRWLAWSGAADHAVSIERVSSLRSPEGELPAEARRKLGGVGQQITRVAFSTSAADARRRQEQGAGKRGAEARQRAIVLRQRRPADAAAGNPPARIALARGGAAGADLLPRFDGAFDIEDLAVVAAGAEADWAPSAGRHADWSIRPDSRPDVQRSFGIERWELLRDGRPAGVIDLAIDLQGRTVAPGRAISWLTKDDDARPWAIAVGTSFGIFVYRLEERPGVPCVLVRWFRGNEDRVLSLAVSEDGRWLASGGGDGVTMIWSLSGIERGVGLERRWGVSLRVVNGRAIVDAVDEAGPLAGKDVRVGDTIGRISFQADRAAARTEHVAGDAIRTALAEVPLFTLVSFTVERGAESRKFVRYPAWENIAGLHLAADGEWAFWTPRGYYAASANGDRSFGWLVNRGIDRLPRFFRANQFRRELERPDVVSRLLVEGSLDAALRAAGRDVPPALGAVLPQQIGQAPEVRILSPTTVDVARAGTVTVEAEVLVPAGVELDRVKAFASGVAARAAPQIVEDIAAAAGRPGRRTYRWQIELPNQDQHLVGVFAGTREGPSDVGTVEIDAIAAANPPRRPKLHVVSAGVNRYARALEWRALGFDMDDLDFAVADATAVRDALASRTRAIYDLGTEPQLLTDRDATRAGCQAGFAALVRQLGGNVAPDDLVVLFLAGHGLRNADAGNAYAFLCHDAELGLSKAKDKPVPTGIGVIGWEDLEPLAELPCRRLALVDTCHSGALGSTTVREFQENMFVVLAAAADNQTSAENPAWGHGAFTKALLEALGAAGGDAPRPAAGGNVLLLDDVIAYVRRRVVQLNPDQTPHASPREILGFVRPPIALVAPVAGAGPAARAGR